MPPHMSAMMLTTAPPFGRAPPFGSVQFGPPAASFSIHWLTHSRANRKPPVDALAREQEAAGQVVADDRVPALGADRRQPRWELAAGVVDERIDPAVAGEHRGDRRLHLRLLADVAHVDRADAARGFDLALHRGQFVGVAADDRDGRAERRELVRSAAADSRAAAGDDGDLALQQAGCEDGAIGGHRRDCRARHDARA